MTLARELSEFNFYVEARKRALDDPVWFAEEILQIAPKPWDANPDEWRLDVWQIELLESIADVYRHKNGLPTKYNHTGKNQITVRSMHGPGKTFGCALALHWFNFCFRGLSPATAPTAKQLQTRLWPAFRKIANRALDGYSMLLEVKQNGIHWCQDPDWGVIPETGAQPENLAGYHDRHMLVVVDEASGVDEKMFPVIEGAISTGEIVILLMIGNPTRTRGSFADSHLKTTLADIYHRMHVTLDKTSRVSPQWVENMIRKYGKDSPVVKVRCLGEFADEDANQLLALEWLERARQRDFVEEGSLPRLRVSVDVADGGEDFTVITVAKHYQTMRYFMRQEEHSFPSGRAPILSAEAAIELFHRYGGDKDTDDIVVDSIGVGAGTAGYLIEKGYNVVLYKGGAASDDTKKWRNRRVQSYIVARDDLLNDNVVVDDRFVDADEWEDFDAQMCSVKRRPGQESNEDLLSKEDMRRQGIKSPDRADSWAMQYATQSPVLRGGVSEPVVVIYAESANYEAGLT